MKKLFLLLPFFIMVSESMAQTQIIAHRGFWKTEGSAQNSIAAIEKANSIECYGSELDVWLSKDNVLVVNHDPSYKEHSMEESDASTLTSLKLKNGETLPTLRDYLTTAKSLDTRPILELKSHSTPERETQAVEKVLELVKELGLENKIEYIAFSLHVVKEFIRLAPSGTPVFYLSGNLSPKELKEIGSAGPDYNLSVFREKPEWIKESQDLGLKVNVWTVNNEKDMEWLIENNVDFITTDEPLLLQEILNRVKK